MACLFSGTLRYASDIVCLVSWSLIYNSITVAKVLVWKLFVCDPLDWGAVMYPIPAMRSIDRSIGQDVTNASDKTTPMRQLVHEQHGSPLRTNASANTISKLKMQWLVMRTHSLELKNKMVLNSRNLYFKLWRGKVKMIASKLYWVKGNLKSSEWLVCSEASRNLTFIGQHITRILTVRVGPPCVKS